MIKQGLNWSLMIVNNGWLIYNADWSFLLCKTLFGLNDVSTCAAEHNLVPLAVCRSENRFQSCFSFISVPLCFANDRRSLGDDWSGVPCGWHKIMVRGEETTWTQYKLFAVQNQYHNLGGVNNSQQCKGGVPYVDMLNILVALTQIASTLWSVIADDLLCGNIGFLFKHNCVKASLSNDFVA